MGCLGFPHHIAPYSGEGSIDLRYAPLPPQKKLPQHNFAIPENVDAIGIAIPYQGANSGVFNLCHFDLLTWGTLRFL